MRVRELAVFLREHDRRDRLVLLDRPGRVGAADAVLEHIHWSREGGTVASQG